MINAFSSILQFYRSHHRLAQLDQMGTLFHRNASYSSRYCCMLHTRMNTALLIYSSYSFCWSADFSMIHLDANTCCNYCMFVRRKSSHQSNALYVDSMIIRSHSLFPSSICHVCIEFRRYHCLFYYHFCNAMSRDSTLCCPQQSLCCSHSRGHFHWFHDRCIFRM